MKQVAARTIKPKTLTLPETTEAVERTIKVERATMTQQFKTLAEQVAKSSVYFKNFYPAELRERFKFFDRMKRIDFCFPYARLGDSDKTTMLLVDAPETEADVEVCYQKKSILDEAGYKYAVIEKDATLYDVLKQLGAL